MVRIKYVGNDEEEFYVKRYLKRYYYTWMKCKSDGLLMGIDYVEGIWNVI